jgi:cardiolipin synthase (CMP-forming)
MSTPLPTRDFCGCWPHRLPAVSDNVGALPSRRVLTVPNLLSFARLLLVPAFLWAFLSHRNVAAFVILFFAGSTDWVDGFVARHTGQVSELGKLLDPLADRVAIVAVLIALAARGAVPWPLAGAILLRDGLVAIVFPVLEAKGVERIPVNIVGKAATLLIFLGMGAALGSVIFVAGWHSFFLPSSRALLIGGAILYWVAAGLYVGEIRRRLGGARKSSA